MKFYPLMHKCTLVLLFSFMVKGFLLPQFASSMMSSCTMKCTMRLRRNFVISMTKSHHVGSQIPSELAIYNGATEEVTAALALLSYKRPQLHITHKPPPTEPNPSEISTTHDVITWSAHGGNLQLDCALLEPQFLGNTKLSNELTAQKWDEMLSQRLTVVKSALSDRPKSERSTPLCMGDGGHLQRELDTAVFAVQRASFMSRSLQKNLVTSRGESLGALNKDDKSPVTIADFAVQALIIHALSREFPGDRFIAEENSELLLQDNDIKLGVLEALLDASGFAWTEKMLIDTIDKGMFDGSAERVWVLDPVDGTKGFMRGEHYCIALALLVKGQPVLSVLGCPNLHLNNLLQPVEPPSSSSAIKPRSEKANSRSVSYVADGISYPSLSNDLDVKPRIVFPPSAGSVFFAVTGRGSFCRSLSMPFGAAFEVEVSACGEAKESRLCESSEATHGDRGTTIGVSTALKLKYDFIRLDGQCKYCVVGSGGAEGNMRLPPKGYVEKVWDHAPGEHFIVEAGGKVTDLQGIRLDFSKGRMLDVSVTGILASNGVMHQQLLSAISDVRGAPDIYGTAQPTRPTSMN